MPNARYQPLGPLNSGKGSHAYLALQIPESSPRTPLPVVLVWLPDDAAKDRDLVAAVERETQRAAQLEHPNIIHVFGSTLHEGRWARVVEYADGESLRRVLEVAKKLKAPLAARVIADAAMGTHYAHLAGNDDGTPLVHGDLRPETLLVAFSGGTKVSGYGALALAPKEPGGRRVRGRRNHCAPEQILGGRNAVNVRTDVYLLGVTLYEAITGLVPFEDEVDFDQAVLSKPLTPIAEELCPAPLFAVIAQAMSKKAVERFASALAFKEALEKALPLAGSEDVAVELSQLFPDDQSQRTARQVLIEEGIARHLANIPKPLPPPPPSAAIADASVAPTEILTQPAVLPEPSPVVAPPRPSPKPVEAPAPGPALFASSRPSGSTPRSEEPPRRGVGVLVAVVAILALIGIISMITARRSQEPRPITMAPPAIDAGSLKEPLSSSDAGRVALASAQPDGSVETPTQEPDASVETAKVEPPDAGAPVVVQEHATTTTKPVMGKLQLFVDPNVEVAVDGKPVGRTPFTIPIAPGKHLLRLTHKTKNINTTRTVIVPPEGGSQTQRIYLRRGYLNVNAPEGSPIFIDGKRVSTAPAREIGVYEGSHKLMVMVNGTKWQQAFEAHPNERTTFTVNFR